MSCRGGSFTNPGGSALSAGGARIAGNALLDEGFAAEGEVGLPGAQIGGLMSCRGGSFTNPGGSALSADGARIAGNALLDEGFAAEGEVRLAGMQAHVMRCRRGSFTNPSGSALSADGASVTGGVFLDEGFAAEGEVGLPGAQIGGVLRCSGGTFKNPSGSALLAEGARVTGGVFLGEGFAAEGEVLFSGAQVEGQFRCNGGVFTNPGGDAFEGRGMTVADRFIWLPRYRPEGMVSFRNARVHQLVDARETWPASRGIVLDGFSYDAIFCTPEDVGPAERIRWLCRNHRYSPQPYEQLAGFYRREGNESAARQVAIAKQIARRQDGGLRWWQRVWSKFLGATVGYGYRPWLAVFWLLGIWLVGVALFNWGPDAHQVMQRLGGENSPRFSPWIYPLDAILPIINLRQRDFWLPNVAKPWGTWYATYVMAGMFAGWALTSAVVAALTGLIRKD
jgi:type IV secretory pathway TrbD component